MKIISGKQYEKMQSELTENKTAIQELVGQKNQMMLSVNRLIDYYEKEYTGNKYNKYDDAVEAIDEKYRGIAQWGTVLTGNIIDLRAAFVIMNGLKIRKKSNLPEDKSNNVDETLEWIENFLDYNEINGIMIYQLASEAEIEGKIALWIRTEKESDYPTIRFISYTNKKYDIQTSKNDYLDYEKITWKDKSGKNNQLSSEYFVYNKFGGRITDPNEACPVVMRCLTQIDDVDKAMTDWRMINNLFAAPIAHIDTETPAQATAIKDQLLGKSQQAGEINWKLRKLLITSGTKYSLVSPSMGGVDSLEKEITAKVKLISGTAAIPIHYLGLLDLLKNRATGENTREMIIAGTKKPREIWKSTWREVINKSIAAVNAGKQKYSDNRKLNPDCYEIEIPAYTNEQWDHIEKVLMPLYLANGISARHLLSQIPDVDVESEIAEIEENADAKMPETGIPNNQDDLTNE
jgi:hypothetical protein